MIHVTNDWILKPLPNNDISTESTYTNNLSADLFPFLARLKSGDRGVEKYITSSTDLDIPLYQPDPIDVLDYSSDLAMNRVGRNIDTYCSPLTDRSSTYNRSWSTSFVENLRTNPEGADYGKEDLCRFMRTTYSGGSYIYTPIEFKFFNPSTCDYDKTLVLGAKREYQKYYYVNGRRTKRTYTYRYNLYWYNKDNTSELYPALTFDSHINIMPDDDVQVTGDGLTFSPWLYLYADVGFDPINEKWVGLLNLCVRMISNNGLEYFTADDAPRSSTGYRYSNYAFFRIMGRDIVGPYGNAYSNALGTSYTLSNVYCRAFELKDQPTIQIEQRTDPLPKIGCYGPNTRISP